MARACACVKSTLLALGSWYLAKPREKARAQGCRVLLRVAGKSACGPRENWGRENWGHRARAPVSQVLKVPVPQAQKGTQDRLTQGN
jgi:hypothetical protein